MNKLLKGITLSVFCTLSLLIVFSVTISCRQEKCKAIVCANESICNNGKCICKPGYAGEFCDSLSKKNFLGIWTVEETGTISPHTKYSISVSSDTPANGVIIYNFYNYFRSRRIRGVINGDTITIPNQQYLGKVIVGQGFICPSAEYGRYGAIVLKYKVVDTATQQVDDYGIYPLIDKSVAASWFKQ